MVSRRSLLKLFTITPFAGLLPNKAKAEWRHSVTLINDQVVDSWGKPKFEVGQLVFFYDFHTGKIQSAEIVSIITPYELKSTITNGYVVKYNEGWYQWKANYAIYTSPQELQRDIIAAVELIREPLYIDSLDCPKINHPASKRFIKLANIFKGTDIRGYWNKVYGATYD